MQFRFIASCTQIPEVLSLKSGAKVQISWRRRLRFTIKNFLLDLRRAGLVLRASNLVDRLTTRLLGLSVPVFWFTHRGRSGFSVDTQHFSARSLTKFHQVIFTF